METTLVVIGLILGSSGLTALVNQAFSRKSNSVEIDRTVIEIKRTEAETQDIIVKASKVAVGLVSEQLEKALNRIDHLEKEVQKLSEIIKTRDVEILERVSEIAILKQQVDQLERREKFRGEN